LSKAKPKRDLGLVAKSKARKCVPRVARGKPKPGHIVGHSRRRRKGEILCHNYVLASDEWEVCPCGWRPELGKHYAKASHVSGGASKSKSAEVSRLSTVRFVSGSASTATGTWDDARLSKFPQVLGNEHWARKILLHLVRRSRIIIVRLPVDKIQIGFTPRLGIAGRDDTTDIVTGIVLMQKFERTMDVVSTCR
jgi:hypothetical protein